MFLIPLAQICEVDANGVDSKSLKEAELVDPILWASVVDRFDDLRVTALRDWQRR
jgi:hypothetical protein